MAGPVSGGFPKEELIEKPLLHAGSMKEHSQAMSVVATWSWCDPGSQWCRGNSRVLCPLALSRPEWIQSGPLISSDTKKCREAQEELQDTQTNGTEGSRELSSIS